MALTLYLYLLFAGGWQQLVTKQLVGILLVICVRQEHVPHIRSMQTAAASVGIMGIMVRQHEAPLLFATGHFLAQHSAHSFLSDAYTQLQGNKGGVAARFMFYDSSICILNSHLNAHYDRVQRRNQDYKDIISKLLVQNDLDIFDHEYVAAAQLVAY